MNIDSNVIVSGTKVSYYIICKRKLWLFSRNISFEKYNENVVIGKLISSESFSREREREIEISESKIDYLKIGDEIIVNEIKKSKSLEEAHIWQVKYYIYLLRKSGIKCNKGVIRYPKLFKKVDVTFESNDEIEIENASKKIEDIINLKEIPKIEEKSYCRKCAYFEFCFI